MVGREDLIKVKRAADRPQDLEDVRALEASGKTAGKNDRVSPNQSFLTYDE